MERINIAELLKDCPKGMELDCTIWDNVTFECVDNREEFSIIIRLSDGCREAVTDYGCYSENEGAKCVIFPKGKTSWEGFKRPFKDGDIAVSNDGSFIGIVKYVDEDEGFIYTYCAINKVGNLTKNFPYYLHRFATEKERQKLFQAIKANGYKWNTETKTLEKLVEPKFKVGDRIILKDNPHNIPSVKIKAVTKTQYILENGEFFYIKNSTEEKYILEDKFNINTLKPFDSRVLVRHNRNNKWCASFFSHIDEDFHSHCYKFVTTSGKSYPYCIPYEGNEHLLAKVDDCDEFYRNL